MVTGAVTDYSIKALITVCTLDPNHSFECYCQHSNLQADKGRSTENVGIKNVYCKLTRDVAAQRATCT